MPAIRFGNLEFDGTQLLREGVPVALSHRHLLALRLLCDAGGQPVSRERLHAELWPDVKVEPASLHRVMSDLRKILGRREDGGQFIDNLARIGYRLNAPAQVQLAVEAEPSSRRIWLAAAAALAGTAVLGVGLAGSRALTESPRQSQAREIYLRGRARWWRRTGTAMAEASQLFREAIHVDPRFAPAYSGLADTLATRADGSKLAWESAERALALDPRCAEAYASLGFIRFARRWQWKQAEEDLRRAVSLADDYAPGLHWLSLLQALTGRSAEALATIEKSLRLDPLSPNLLSAKASYLYMRRDYDGALKLLRETDAVTPGFPFTLQWMGRTEVAMGRLDQGVGTWRKAIAAMEAPGPQQESWQPSSHTPGEGLKWIEGMVVERRGNPVHLGLYAAWIGRPNEALAFLEQAVQRRELLLIYAGADPAFDGIREAPRFAAVLAALRLPGYSPSRQAPPASEDTEKQSG